MGCVFALRAGSACRVRISVGGVFDSGGEMSVGVLRSLGPVCGGLGSSCDILLIGCLLTEADMMPRRGGVYRCRRGQLAMVRCFQTMAERMRYCF